MGLFFGAIHRRVGGGIDDDMGIDLRDDGLNRCRLRQVAFRKIDAEDLAERGQRPPQLEAELAVLADQQQPHGRAP